MDEKLFTLIENIVFKITGKKQITYDTDFIQDLALSSFDIMRIVNEFEEVFDTEIPNRDVWQMHKVQDVIDYMKAHDLTEIPSI